ncbi:uncharacterized protein LOC131875015 [Cryptomeria japonica]|uniref:uncharacterized protein LOC131875015 n=1 Tax=Cryptomeria japonica TaxID=3369 RepID=UPI0027D9D421|nr:uncharacterized protein LOC131875015 [Cryptomeria japonica]
MLGAILLLFVVVSGLRRGFLRDRALLEVADFRLIGVTIVSVTRDLLLLSQRRVRNQLLVEAVLSSRARHQVEECSLGEIASHVDNQVTLLFIVLSVLLKCQGSRSQLLSSLQLEIQASLIAFLRRLITVRLSIKPPLLRHQMKRCVRKGCQLFVVRVKDVDGDVSLEDLLQQHPILQEFADVFPSEIPGIPPQRDIDFRIDLVPRAEPIYKAPYRMTTQELDELRVQLEELLAKGFIHPNVSPRVDPSKIRAIVDWVAPTNVGECEIAFQILKERLTNAPILAVPDPLGNFVVCTDASLEGRGEILIQDGHGKENVVADALSRRKHEISSMSLSVDLRSRILSALSSDAEHQHLAGLLQSDLVPGWKWDIISMDFIVGLLMSSCRHDAIMVIVDRLTKVAHFSPIRSSNKAVTMARVFLEGVVSLSLRDRWTDGEGETGIGGYVEDDMEDQVACIREHLLAAKDRQKKYADAHRVDRQFSVGNRHKEMSLRGQSVEQVRIQWDPIDDSSATWEDAVRMRELYPYFFSGFQV